MAGGQVSGSHASRSEKRIQHIHGSVGLDAWRILGHALAAGEADLALIAAPGVHAVDGNARRIEWFVAHVSGFECTLCLEFHADGKASPRADHTIDRYHCGQWRRLGSDGERRSEEIAGRGAARPAP